MLAVLQAARKAPLTRIFQRSESDFRFQGRELSLERHSTNRGRWERDAKGAVRSSSAAPPALDGEEAGGKVLAGAAHEIIRASQLKPERHRIAYRFEDRRIVNQGDLLHQTKRSLYVEVTVQGETHSLLLPEPSSQMKELQNFVDGICTFQQLPEMESPFHADLLELSGPAFGYLLHEGLGHRLESDDYRIPIDFKTHKRRGRKLDFSVADVPGDPRWAGHTPFDDEGVMGSAVRLLNGEDGSQNLMTEDSGNMRAVDWSWHPVIRQRCLMVNTLCASEPLLNRRSKGTLRIDSVSHGSLEGGNVVLSGGLQRYIDGEGRAYRLPPLTLTVPVCSLNRFRPFGETAIHHPGGGCHKGLQRGLDVTFCAPSAWAPISVARITP